MFNHRLFTTVVLCHAREFKVLYDNDLYIDTPKAKISWQ